MMLCVTILATVVAIGDMIDAGTCGDKVAATNSRSFVSAAPEFPDLEFAVMVWMHAAAIRRCGKITLIRNPHPDMGMMVTVELPACNQPPMS